MHKVSVNKVGLAFGGLFGIVHLVWALMVLFGWAQAITEWIFALHFMSFQFVIAPFSFGTAVGLVVVTAIVGYVFGVILGWLWNLFHRESHNEA